MTSVGHKELKRLNSLAPVKFEWNFRYLIFWIISVIDGWVISSELALRWMSLDLTDDKSTLVQVMAWCHQATSHYLNQCWPRSMWPNGITRPQWVNVQFSTQPTTAFCLREIFQILLKMGRHLRYPCISCCNIWYAKICASPTVLVGIFYVLTHCRPKMPFLELIFAKNFPGEDPGPPLVALGAFPHPLHTARRGTSHHFAPSCSTYKFSRKRKSLKMQISG